jgi:glycosyltransferase involved in cell wall biosynthesis
MGEPSFAFVFMGRRGGGNDLLASLIDNLSEAEIDIRFIVSQRNESIALLSQNKNVTLLRTDSMLSLLMASWREVRNNVDNYVFVMQHPHDLFIWILARIFHKSRILMVHDNRRHRGDIYPRNSGLRLRAKFATQRIFFTRFVASQYSSRKSDFVWRFYDCLNKKRTVPPENYILTIGRLRRYQGIHLIPRIASNLQIKFDRWIIAGNSKFEEPRNAPNIEVHAKWLTIDEIDSKIKSARVVVLPYIEASQSGVLPRIAKLGVPIVITPVGGLPEQVESLEKCVIARGMDELSIAQAIETAWNFDEILDSQVSEFNEEALFQDLIMYLKSHGR